MAGGAPLLFEAFGLAFGFQAMGFFAFFLAGFFFGML